MDLSFAGFDRLADASAPLPVDLAVLLVGIAARQAASPTAIAHVRMRDGAAAASRFMPVDGAFDGATARALADWKEA